MKRKRQIRDDELFRFADEYLREAFLNPARQGCPTEVELRNAAENPTKTGPGVVDHVSQCSPCYEQYSAILEGQKTALRQSLVRKLKVRRLRFAVAPVAIAVVLAVVAGVLLIRSNRKQPVSYAKFTIDLSGASPSRGSNERARRAPIQVPQERLDLDIQLPIGSEEGAYEVSLQSGPSVLWSEAAEAKLIDHAVRIRLQADLHAVAAGQYHLVVESKAGFRYVQPIELIPATRASVVSGGSLFASLTSRVASIQLPRTLGQKPLSAEPATGDANKLIAEADGLAFLANWPAAAPLYAKAEQLATQHDDEKARIHAKIGRIRGQAESMPFTQVSEMIAAELRNPIVQNDPKLRLFALTAKGYTDLDVNLASCRTAWDQALETARELHDPLWENRASGELGIIAFLEGDSAKAEKLVGAALLGAMRNGDVAAQIRFLTMIGNGLADLQRYDDASQFFTRALKLAGETQDAGFPFMAYEGQARCLTALGKTSEAQRLLQTALQQARRDGKRGHQSQILTLLGELAERTNNLPEAEEDFRAAGELSRTAQFPRMEAEAMYQLAGIYQRQQKQGETEECLRRGIAASRAVGDTYYLPRDLSALAEIRAAEGDSKSADALWEQATDLLDGMLVDAPSAYARSTMVAAASDIYLRHFTLAAREKDVAKAFRIVERARGRSVADLLWHRSAEEQPRTNENAARQVADLQLKLIRSESSNERQNLLSQLFEAEQKEAFAATKTSAPYAVEGPATLRSIERTLLPDETLLEYVLSDPESYCIAVTRTAAHLVPLGASRGRIELLVHDFVTRVRSQQDSNKEANQLYGLLLEPISPGQLKARLVIVPDGILHLVPFDALQRSDGRYVLDSSVVTYAPSATVLRMLRIEQKTKAPLPLLGVGGVDYGSAGKLNAKSSGAQQPRLVRGVYDLAGARFEPLPGSKAEVLNASSIFGPGSVVLIGSNATEAEFKHEPLENFRIIHMAVHGFASTTFPERSALVLAPGASEDGLLQTREIAGLNLNADLVTLSACDTDVGRMQGEEGNASLQRAFLLAGAKATLSTLWSADDTFTAALIRHFYTNLAGGMDKGAALRKAKLDLIKQFGSKATPFYWAGFVLDGEASTPVFPRK